MGIFFYGSSSSSRSSSRRNNSSSSIEMEIVFEILTCLAKQDNNYGEMARRWSNYLRGVGHTHTHTHTHTASDVTKKKLLWSNSGSFLGSLLCVTTLYDPLPSSLPPSLPLFPFPSPTFFFFLSFISTSPHLRCFSFLYLKFPFPFTSLNTHSTLMNCCILTFMPSIQIRNIKPNWTCVIPTKYSTCHHQLILTYSLLSCAYLCYVLFASVLPGNLEIIN